MGATMRRVYWLFMILFLSGTAALINQVVWQRAIKVYLGGADALCSMIVVLVFMLGLGVGSLLISKKAADLVNPLKTLALLELALFVVNVAVLLILKIDFSETVFAFQRAAVSFGLPLKLLYALSATLLLLVPCSVMGMTMPVASEAASRALNYTKPWLVDHMFFFNTLGSCLGALFTGFKLLPYYGQTICLILASVLNLAAAGLLFYLDAAKQKVEDGTVESETEEEAVAKMPEEILQPLTVVPEQTVGRGFKLRDEEIATFFLGFVSLGYEIHLFRTLPLLFEPLPHTFSLILTFYLIAWAIGVRLAEVLKESVNTVIILGGLTIAVTPYTLMYDRLLSDGPSAVAIIIYLIPCLSFGILFGQLLKRFISNWGTDVGRYMGLNTLGSCLGIFAVTMVGGNIYHAFNAWILATIMLTVGAWLFLRSSLTGNFKKYCNSALLLIGVIAVSGMGMSGSLAPHMNKNFITYSDPAGITELTSGGNMIWDGLWHSALSDGKSHIGTNNWQMAAIPLLCLSEEAVDEALVIGLGIGITAATLAKSDQIGHIDGYEINNSIKNILTDYSENTLDIINNPKVSIIWQDARTGLALNEKKYKLITQQPLYLKQAGSSNLLSEEYLRLVAKRLDEDGIFVVYANSQGNQAQKMVVRKTLAEVFPHIVSFLDEYLYVVSHSPITYDKNSLQQKLTRQNDGLIDEIKAHFDLESLLSFKDSENDAYKKAKVTIKDDYPILEYPAELEAMSSTW
jgi:spermidine synthase